MIQWRPTLSEFTDQFRRPRSWAVSLERFGKGIDNAHVDVFLSPRLRDRLEENVRKRVLEDLHAQSYRSPEQLVSAQDLESFRDAYLGLFEAALERTQARADADRLALLQIALLKCLLETVARVNLALQEELKGAVHDGETRASGRALHLHEQLVALSADDYAINRRVLHVLFRQIRQIEGGQMSKVRASVLGEPWPLPEAAFFNPVILIPRLNDVRALAQDYPVALLGEQGRTDWLYQTNQCLSKVFQHYLPAWTQAPSRLPKSEVPAEVGRERRDQGLLPGFLESEILLRRFVPEEEYRTGLTSWLDEPECLRRFLTGTEPATGPCAAETLVTDLRWRQFRQAITAELHLCLQMQGLGERLSWIYWLAALRGQLGRGVPLGLLVEFFEGRLSRRRLLQRLESQRTSAEAAGLARLLERSLAETRRSALLGRGEELNRYLVDFVVLRRDLKLAYRVYEAMDRIRLLDAPDEVRLSRSNGSLIEFPCHGDLGPVPRRIRGHAVIKADVRGSTRITEMLRARGLNPASHFSLNFFDPVTKLLSDFGAEKLFVEGDAVILAIFEYDGEGPGMAVARACGLARKILQVVALQNVLNRRHELPELELGLGITFLPEEPNFLYDEGHRIMISGAINRADRLSSSSEGLRREGFSPGHPGFRVALVRDRRRSHAQGEDLLRYNVNGIRLEESAFFKLQREVRLEQGRAPEGAPADGLFFTGTYSDAAGRDRFLVVRHAPVRDWDGRVLGEVDPERRHFFEVIVDEALGNALRRATA